MWVVSRDCDVCVARGEWTVWDLCLVGPRGSLSVRAPVMKNQRRKGAQAARNQVTARVMDILPVRVSYARVPLEAGPLLPGHILAEV